MLFVATFEHTPDNCWARDEHADTAESWVGSLDERAEEHGVELHGAFVTPNEHRFYFVVEADRFEAVTGFFGPPWLHDHEGHIAPVMTLGEAVDVVIEE